MFEKSFCSSPWIHMRIDAQGNFKPCRWIDNTGNDLIGNIREDSLIDYFQNTMSPMRMKFLQGTMPDMCYPCQHMEQHGKVSGRQRQLLKVGVMQRHFLKTLRSSPMLENFSFSDRNQGRTDLWPQEWQIDLGNYCNSACLFCSPNYSSKLAVEHKKLGLIDSLPVSSWADDPVLVTKFCNFLTATSRLAYLHFLGGETLITPAFRTMLRYLVDQGMTDAHIGFTTNLTVWPEEVIELLKQFKNLHVGLSVECLHPLNDYIRWPSKIDTVREILDRWVYLSHQQGWLVQLRPTPNCLTLLYLDSIYEYAMTNKIGVETCNFIERPREMRINAMPPALMAMAQQKIQSFLDRHQISVQDHQIINTRNPENIDQQVWQDAHSYLRYLKGEDHDPVLLSALVQFLKRFELNRGNSVLDYLPEYEKFLRHANY